MSSVTIDYQMVMESLNNVIRDLSAGGLYAPMMRRMSVRIDDSRPAHMKRVMDARGASMSTDGQTIGIDSNNLHSLVNEAIERYNKKYGSLNYYDLDAEVRNILIHELTHALCKHPAQGAKVFNDRRRRGHQKTLAKELVCWNIACEIEANRGYGIKKSCSPIYEIGVTEESYPETKGCKYLLDIFHKLLSDYQDQISEDMQAISDALKQLESEGEQNGETQQNSQGQSNPEQGGEKNSGENAERQSSSSSSQESLKLGENAKEQQRREALKKLVEETMREGDEKVSSKLFNPNDERNHEVIFDEQGAAFSHGGDNIDGNFNMSGEQVLKALEDDYENWRSENVKKALAKLKGAVVGQISKNRVATYSRQARRDTSDGLLKKGHKRERRSSPKILLALDKSGSMSSVSTQRATEAVANIFDTTGRPTEGCWICLHDGRVQVNRPMKQWKFVVQGFHPSGGNDFSEVIKLANKLGVDVVLNVGDGGDYTTRDAKAAKDFMKAGRKWYDVNITGSSRSLDGVRDNIIWWKGCYEHDAHHKGIIREMIDLTGCIELTDELNNIFKQSNQKVS